MQDKLRQSIILFFRYFNSSDTKLMEIYRHDLSSVDDEWAVKRLDEVRRTYEFRSLPNIGYILKPFYEAQDLNRKTKKGSALDDFSDRFLSAKRTWCQYNSESENTFEEDVESVARKLGGWKYLNDIPEHDFMTWKLKQAREIFETELEKFDSEQKLNALPNKFNEKLNGSFEPKLVSNGN